MQVNPIKLTLKAPGTKRLRLKHDEPLPSFAFKFNLRRYNKADAVKLSASGKLDKSTTAALDLTYKISRGDLKLSAGAAHTLANGHKAGAYTRSLPSST